MKLERIQNVSTDKPGSPTKPGGIRGAVQVVTDDALSVNDKPEERPKQQYQGTLYNKKRVLDASAEEKTDATVSEAKVVDSAIDITV